MLTVTASQVLGPVAIVAIVITATGFIGLLFIGWFLVAMRGRTSKEEQWIIDEIEKNYRLPD